MVNTESIQDKLVIKVNEIRVDMVVARKFREVLSGKLSDNPKEVILNLENVEYFDSSALGAIVAFMKEIRSYDGKLRLCNINRSILTLLKLSKLDLLFDIRDTLENAISEPW
jgi:anti-sigma B factor antagonist